MGEAFERMARAISQLRVDCVGWREGTPWIVEVKPAVVSAALGQLLCYRWHWLRDHPGAGAAGLVLVAGVDNADVGEVLDVFDVKRIIVGVE